MRWELEKEETIGLEKVIALRDAVIDALGYSKSDEELAENLRALGVPVTLDEVKALGIDWSDVDEWSNPLGVNNVFLLALRAKGYTAFKLYRAVAVVLPARVEYKVVIQGMEVDRMVDEAMAIAVFSDPDSSIVSEDVVILTGFRFGLDSVLVNGRHVKTVHGDHKDEFDKLLERLRNRVTDLNFAKAKEDNEAVNARRVWVEQALKWLDEIKERVYEYEGWSE